MITVRNECIILEILALKEEPMKVNRNDGLWGCGRNRNW